MPYIIHTWNLENKIKKQAEPSKNRLIDIENTLMAAR